MVRNFVNDAQLRLLLVNCGGIADPAIQHRALEIIRGHWSGILQGVEIGLDGFSVLVALPADETLDELLSRRERCREELLLVPGVAPV